MFKQTFIPKKFRPTVPGSTLRKDLKLDINLGVLKVGKEETYPIIISSKEDIVPQFFLKEVQKKNKVKHLFYDDLGFLWDFSYSNNKLRIYFENLIINPLSIYHRHPGIKLDHPKYNKHVAFFEVLDIWHGNLIGQTRDNFHNSSKAYQGITSINNSTVENRKNNIKYPISFFIKGDYNLLKKKFKNPLVVKSCSSVRSQVVSEEEFSKWNKLNLYNLPTFFQQQISGKDIRVHIYKNKRWALEISNKDCTDYRYSTQSRIIYKQIKLPKSLQSFCSSLSYKEGLKLSGIDFIKDKNTYYCLESNPGPGWSTYRHASKTKFANYLYTHLIKENDEEN